MAKLSIILPIYNEKMHIREVLNRIRNASLPYGIEREIIIVDDGSNDGTTEILKNIIDTESEGNVVTVHHSVLNFGKGIATRIGIHYATGDIILVQDGDMEYDPNDYTKLISPILEGKSSIVYGTRFHKRPKGMTLPNYIANKLLTFFTNLLYNANITDEATAYKVFRSDVLKNLTLKSRRFEFCPEVTAKTLKRGYTIHDVPIHYDARTIEEGKKIRWKDGFVALWTLLKYKFVD